MHPDGRLQRLRIAIAAPRRGPARLARDRRARRGAAALDLGVRRSADAFEQLVAAVPFYAGLTLEEIGGTACAGPSAAAAAGVRAPAARFAPLAAHHDALAPEATNGHLALGTYRPLWAAPEVEISPALQYLVPHQSVELSPPTPPLRGIAHGEEVVVSQNGTRLAATAVSARASPTGPRSSPTGSPIGSANALTGRLIEVREGRMNPVLAAVNYFEPWWVQIIKALVIFGIIFAILPILIIYERKLIGRYPEPLRAQPRRPVRPDAAARRDRQVRHQGAVPPDDVGRLPVPDRADDRDPHRRHLAGDHPVRQRSAHLRARVGLYGIDVSVGPLFVFAFGGIAFYGIMLGGWASGSKYSFLGRDARRRPADLLRGLPEPGAGRRDHHQRARCRSPGSSTRKAACGSSSRSSRAF